MTALEEPEAKEKYMRRLMLQLLEPNYSTAMFILDHLIKYVFISFHYSGLCVFVSFL